MAGVSRLAEGFLAKAPPGSVACRAGCDHCCYQVVGVTPPEALAIVDHLKKTLTSAALSEPLRSEPTMVMTFSLSAIFKSSNSLSYVPPRHIPIMGLTRAFSACEPPARKPSLRHKRPAIEAVSGACYWRLELSMTLAESRLPLFGGHARLEETDG